MTAETGSAGASVVRVAEQQEIAVKIRKGDPEQTRRPPPVAVPPARTSRRVLAERTDVMWTCRDTFVGRHGELALLEAELRQTCTGTPRLVWLEGEAGMGRTALLRRFLSTMPERDVLWAVAEPSEASRPFGLIDRLVPGIAASAPDAEPRAVADPQAVGEALWAALRMRAAHAPLVVAVDDAHWADEPSCEALLHAACRARGCRLLWLLSVRAEATVPGLPRWRQLFTDPARGCRLSLGGLDAEELRRLAAVGGARLTPRAGERLRLLTAGSPYYAHMLLEANGGETLNLPEPRLEVPPRLMQEAQEVLSGLPADAACFAQAAAVLAEEATFSSAARLSGVTDPRRALAATQGARLLRPEAGGRLAFAVPLLGAAIAATLPTERVRELHRRAAAELAGPSALRHRFGAACGPDAGLAVALERAASDDVEMGADAAAALMRAAAELSPDSAGRERRLLLSVLLMLRGGDDEGAQMLRRAAERYRPSPLRDVVLGALDLEAGRLGPADEALTRALGGGLCEPDGVVRAAAGACLVRLRAVQGRTSELTDLAETVLTASSALPAVRLYVAQTCLWCQSGVWPTASALGVVRALLARHPAGAAAAEEHLLRGLELACRHQPDAAARELTWALESAGPHAPGHPPIVHLWLAETELTGGRWSEAFSRAMRVAALSDVADPLGVAVPAHALLARLNAARGDLAQAALHLQVAATRATPSRNRAPLELARAQLALAEGRPADALSALDRLAAAGPIGEELVLRADALLRLSDLGRAARAVARVEAEAAGTASCSWLHLAVARLRGELAMGRGDDAGAAAALEAGMLLCVEGQPAARVALELAYARLLRRTGRIEAATLALRAARERLELLGATSYLGAVLREIGSGCGAPGGQARWAGRLTPRERQVAQLAAAGHSNREIARRLHVTIKAVEYHLTHVFAKLGVNSRHDLSPALALGDPPVA
jgi:DNA-binding CsgD family transcriptional regulator